MMRRYGLSWILVLFCVLFAATAANAQWVKDGAPVCTELYGQGSVKVIPDGRGGAIAVWTDFRNGNSYDIYGNDIEADGYVYSSAVPICTAIGNQSYPQAVFNGTEGVIVVWIDERSGMPQIYAQRVDTTGTPVWTLDGIDISPSAYYPGNVRIISDGAGGAIVAWYDYPSGSGDIFAQRIDVDGNLYWGPDGILVCDDVNEQNSPEIVADGSGGAVIVWADHRSGEVGDGDIYAQRVDAEGNLLWADDMPVCIAGESQGFPSLVGDSNGGAYITWHDFRNGYWDVYVQRIDQNGSPVWTLDGINVCSQSWFKTRPQIVADGSGGVIVAWWDDRSVDYEGVYAQRIDSDGTPAWVDCGVQLFPSDAYTGFVMIPDGNGGAIVAVDAWNNDFSYTDIYAQKVDYDGNVHWGPKGIAVCLAENYQLGPDLVSDGFGGAVIAWEDYRVDGNYSDLYAQRISASGLWGNPAPEILSCLDVPADQGGWVRITSRASIHDVVGEENSIFGYNVWRLISGGGGLLAASANAPSVPTVDRSKALSLLKDPATAKGVRVSGADAVALGLPDGDWESVGFWFATRDTVYNVAVPTKNDSTEAGTPWETFIVTAHASTAGIFVASEPAMGYSVDNLAPAMTGGLAGEQSLAPAGLRLAWDMNVASDMWKYNVHRGDDALFVPDESNLIGTTTDLTLLDPGWASFYNYFYKLVAVDRHGNKSAAALLRPEDVKVGTLLQGFAATLKDIGVEIVWTLSEADGDVQFAVLRSEANGAFEALASPAISRDALTFSLSDESVEPGTTYRYRVDVVEESRTRVLFETESISTPAIPLTLYQNHPNPFNPSTTISFYVPVATQVTLDIYDSAGKLVSRPVDRVQMPRGTHAVEWRGLDSVGRSVSSGVYFYRLRAGRETISKKMVLLR